MKPARIQVDKATLDAYLRGKRPEGGTYNIWHNRWTGLERDWSKKTTRSEYRCHPEKDAGYTSGTSNPQAYFCLYFAKGMCIQGPKCSRLHRIPNDNDEVQTTIDCFGRDKKVDFRQDMGGIGSFSNDHRTLYVGHIAVTENMEDVVRRHFSDFGTLEKVVVQRKKGIAFVTYTSRNNADFAREAMMSQNLDNNEIINVRWATPEQSRLSSQDVLENENNEEENDFAEDPNGAPKVKVPVKRHVENSGVIEQPDERQDTEADLPAEFTQLKRDIDEDGFRNMEMETKRQRVEELEQYRAPVYDTQSATAIYGYIQGDSSQGLGQTPQQALAQEQARSRRLAELEKQPKKGGILSHSVLDSLKSLRKNVQLRPISIKHNLSTQSDSDSE